MTKLVTSNKLNEVLTQQMQLKGAIIHQVISRVKSGAVVSAGICWHLSSTSDGMQGLTACVLLAQ